ncbi:uroporphyrinogen-III C-methyltransferase [Vibrio sp. JC009]|uniref:uroporphyrinogen-III C-methyltransferase n=1 Tax=Vibrio sp. JC009 TaxID=2912314 RepID=UPI0023B1B1F3|nr:uroporphyrinogen-III C-methyltransferase [Vibrio sp. JC009]WED21767.1 uroporphyrinogen-III C-methyltransferase [Vibrio sp. JC009]
MTSKNNENIESENKNDVQPEETSQQEEQVTSSTSADSATDSADSVSQPEPASTPEIKFEEKQGKRGVKLATLAIVLSLFVGGGAAYLSNQQALQYQAQVEALSAQVNQLNSQLNQKMAETKNTVSKQLQNLDNKTETQFGQQHESIKSIQLAIADIKGRRPNDWLLAEADYLVKLAGRKLFLEKDVESATLLMESADQRISALNDPSLVPLRKEMTKDIVALKAVPLIDKDGLAIRLTELQELVDRLPLANAILPDAPVAEEAVISEDINDWQENLMTSLKDFSEEFITFRTRDGNVIPLLSPKQHYYLKENIKGKIENAVRAVYNENGEVYKTSLKVANEWAKQFFKLDDPSVAQFSRALQDLGGKDIQVNYPVKLVSQKALSDVINERLRREVTSMTMEEKE